MTTPSAASRVLFVDDDESDRRLERALAASETRFRVLTSKLSKPVSPLH